MKRCVVLVSLFCLLLFLPVAAAGGGGAYPETVRTAREILWKTLTTGGGSSATVAILDGGEIVYSEGFGAAERATNRAVAAETRFNIGSTSKMFVAVAILMLADEGKLTLDDPVAKHLPEFSMRDERSRDITVRMLFNHSSGLPGSSFIFEYAPELEPHALLLDVLRDSDLKHAPGAMGIYCNDGFTLAEMIVERLSGKKFVDFVAERIFEPLGMEHSGASVGETGGEVAFYYHIPTGRKFPLEVVRVHAAGGLSSTAEDLCRFADAFTEGGRSILSEASVEELLKSQPTLFTKHLRGIPIFDAFGWDYAWIPEYREKGVQVLGKSGGTMFYSTNLLLLPAERLAVAVSISGRTDATGISLVVLDALMRDKGLPAREKAPPTCAPWRTKLGESAPIPAELFDFEGFYTDGNRAVRFLFDREEHVLSIHHALPVPPEGTEMPPPVSLVYGEGFFRNVEMGTSYYFVAEGDEVFLVSEKIPGYGMNAPAFQRLNVPEMPQRLSVEMNGVLWAVRNLPPMAQVTDGFLVFRTSESKELPGYLHSWDVQRIDGPDYAGIAATGFRDQHSLRLFRRNDEVRARMGMFVFSRAGEAEPLREGESRVVVGSDGENEWRRVENDVILSVKLPDSGRVIVVDPENDAALLFDSVADDGEFCAPEGTFVFFAGDPGDVFEVNSR